MAVSREAALAWRAFRLGAWLGWQVESNWTRPWLFALYCLVQPVSQSLVVVAMVYAAGAATRPAEFAAVYVGNALFAYVGSLAFGLSWVVMQDRGQFQMARYVYLAVPSLAAYLLGRGVARFAVTTLSVLVVLAFGGVVLRLPLDPSGVRWGLVAAAFPAGVAACVGLGLALAGWLLLFVRYGGGYSELLAGALYLLSGVLFPPDLLPGPLAAVGAGVPFTWWTEAMRRALLGHGWSGRLAAVPDGALLAALGASAVAALLAGLAALAACERLARRRGMLDVPTEW